VDTEIYHSKPHLKITVSSQNHHYKNTPKHHKNKNEKEKYSLQRINCDFINKHIFY